MQRFRFAEDGRAYVLAHALRRMALASRLHIAASRVEVVSAKSGAPSLCGKQGRGVYFSHSHARGLAACAVTGLGPVGVDVEALDGNIADPALLSGFFALADTRQRESELGPDQTGQFFFYWTLLEAYWKAAGTGLSSSHPPLCCRKKPNGTHEIWRGPDDTGPRAIALPVATPAGWSISLVVNPSGDRTETENCVITYRGLEDFAWDCDAAFDGRGFGRALEDYGPRQPTATVSCFR